MDAYLICNGCVLSHTSPRTVATNLGVLLQFMVETTLSNTQLTKIITIFPMFVVVNKLGHSLLFKEASPPLASDAQTASGNEDDVVDINGGDDLQPIAMSALESAWTSIAPDQVSSQSHY